MTQYFTGDDPGTSAREVSVVPHYNVSMKIVDLIVGESVVILDAKYNRHRLSLQNIGPGIVTIGYSNSVETGYGIILDPAADIGRQGGSWEEPVQSCWNGPISAIAQLVNTRLVIIEG